MLYIPVVDCKSNMNLMYTVKIVELKAYCELYFGFFDEEGEGIGVALTKHQEKEMISLPHPKNIKDKLLERNISAETANNVFKVM